MTEADKEKLQKAIEELEDILRREPENYGAYYFLSLLYLNENTKKALEIMERGIKKAAPHEGELHCLAGLTYFSTGPAERALDLLLEAEKLSPLPQRELYRAIGETYFKLKKYDEAASYFLKMAKNVPHDLDPLFYAADCYRLSLKWNAAEMVINNALKIAPDVRFHNLLAFLSIMRFNFQRANKIYEKIMEIDKKHIPQALFNKGFAFMIMGNYDEALRIWSDLAKNYPSRADFPYSLGFLYFVSRNKEEALRNFSLCIEREPEGKLAKKAMERIEEVKRILISER